MTPKPDLYEYLKKECPDLEAAKLWIHKWFNEWQQVLPWDTEAMYTLRAMCGHLSNVLEGKDYGAPDAYGTNFNMAYFDTKYGAILYEAA